MPLADTKLAVKDDVRNARWYPLYRIENVGGSLQVAIDEYQKVGPAKFIYAEGDSWFDKFSPLLTEDTNLLSHIRTPFSAAVVDVSHIGDTAENMVTGQPARQTRAMFNTLDFDAILLSAGGNDLIAIFQMLFGAKATGKVPPNAWFTLEDLDHLNDPARFTRAFDDLITRIRTFIGMRDRARKKTTRNAPVFLHGYDYIQPRPAAAYLLKTRFIGRGPWVHPLMEMAGLNAKEMRSVADAVIDKLYDRLLNDIIGQHENVHLIDQRGLLTPGAADSKVESNDWLDEIHPNPDGFKKLAQERWEVPLASALGWNPGANDLRAPMAAKTVSTALASRAPNAA